MFREYLERIRSQGERSFTFEKIQADLNTSVDSLKSGLHRLTVAGKIISPAKGLYVLIPPESRPYGCIPAQDLVPILMKYHNAEYYVALLSAGLFHGSTHQKPSRFQLITNKRIYHALEFGQVKIELVYKKNLADLPVIIIPVSTGYLKVASPELVAFDVLTYPEKSGGLSHIATVFSELIFALDSKKLIEFADQIGEVSWLQRFGYILEQIDHLDEVKAVEVIDTIHNYLSQKTLRYIPLVSKISREGYPRIKKWKIIENLTVESDL